MQTALCFLGLLLSMFALEGCGGSNGASPVTVRRSEFNYPALKVETSPSGQADSLLIEEQGFVEAEDRFLQMDILRRTAEGKLSELFGEPTVAQDKRTLAVGLPSTAKKTEARLESEEPEVFGLFQAFARGVNRYLSQVQSENPALLELYRSVTQDAGYVPAPWEPVDSAAVGLTITFYLSSALPEKLAYGALFSSFQALPSPHDKDALDLFDLRPMQNTFILAADSANPLLAPIGAGPSSPAHPFFIPTSTFSKRPPFSTRSDRWDVCRAGISVPQLHAEGFRGEQQFCRFARVRRSKVGVCGYDPHLPLRLPTTFYELALDSQAAGGKFRRVRGLNIPGVPGVLLFGHNDRIAWATTDQPANVDDVYQEVLSPDGSAVRSRTGGYRSKWKPKTFRCARPTARSRSGQLRSAGYPITDPFSATIFPRFNRDSPPQVRRST